MFSPDARKLRNASAIEALEILQSGDALSREELQAALVNAFERLAALEAYWDQFRSAVAAWDAQVKSPPTAG